MPKNMNSFKFNKIPFPQEDMEFLFGVNGWIMEFATMFDSQARIQKVMSGEGSKTRIILLKSSYFTGGDRGSVPLF